MCQQLQCGQQHASCYCPAELLLIYGVAAAGLFVIGWDSIPCRVWVLICCCQKKLRNYNLSLYSASICHHCCVSKQECARLNPCCAQHNINLTPSSCQQNVAKLVGMVLNSSRTLPDVIDISLGSSSLSSKVSSPSSMSKQRSPCACVLAYFTVLKCDAKGLCALATYNIMLTCSALRVHFQPVSTVA